MTAMETYIRRSIDIAKLLQYHGLARSECPVEPSHTLCVVSSNLAICHQCSSQWDVIELHQVLCNLTRQEALDDLWRKVPPSVPEPMDAAENSGAESKCVEESMTYSLTFSHWLEMNRGHIWGLRDWDGDAALTVGFVNLKGNLVLLPQALDGLPFRLLRHWTEEWSEGGLLRKQGDNKGLKRPQRVPLEIRNAQCLPETMRLFTFHRRETYDVLDLVPSRRKNA